jgi:predicted dehydrogenase
VAIAGLGRAGWGVQVPALEALTEQYRVVSVYDPNPQRQADARTRLGCRTHADFADVLSDDEVELVVLATPSHLHADMAIASLRAGKNVIVEKPFATDLADTDRMISAAGQTGRLLTGSQNYRYVADFLKVREVIASGVLGRIVQVRINWHWFRRRWDWQTLKEFGGGSLNNDGSHALDQALLLLGDAEPDVFAHLERTPLSSGDAEDHVKIVLKAPGAPLIDLEFSNAVAYPQEMWLVMGTQGGLAGSHGELRWRYFDPAAVPPRPVSREPTPDRSYNREQLPWIEETCDLGESHTESNKRLYRDLYATLREGAPLAVTPASIRRQIALLEKCRELSPV